MTDDLEKRLRGTLPGIAQAECRGDNLAILLAGYFEPGIEDDEMDDSETWKQGAIDASNAVLDAIHAHYADALAALRQRLAEVEKDYLRRHNDATDWMEKYVIAEAARTAAEARSAVLEAALAKCIEIADHAVDHYKGCVAVKMKREITLHVRAALASGGGHGR